MHHVLPTIGTIAEALHAPIHRIRYIVETCQIHPTGRAGNARVFAEADIERIRIELANIAKVREGADA